MNDHLDIFLYDKMSPLRGWRINFQDNSQNATPILPSLSDEIVSIIAPHCPLRLGRHRDLSFANFSILNHKTAPIAHLYANSKSHPFFIGTDSLFDFGVCPLGKKSGVLLEGFFRSPLPKVNSAAIDVNNSGIIGLDSTDFWRLIF